MTTIFITTLVPPITPSSSSSITTSGNPSTWKQKAVIVGSAVGGFVGFGLILGLLLWFLCFRRGEHKQPRGSADITPPRLKQRDEKYTKEIQSLPLLFLPQRRIHLLHYNLTAMEAT